MLEYVIQLIESNEITPLEALSDYDLMSFEQQELMVRYDILEDELL